jgi:hypothetical protein
VTSVEHPPRAVVLVLDGDVTVATFAVDGAAPALFVVDAVARLRVAAARLGWDVRLAACGAGLREVLDLAGLRVQPVGEPERREQPGIEEVVQCDEPPT